MSTRTVLVTGASRGIGRAIAVRLARSGWQVYGGVRTDLAAKELAAESDRITPVELDVTVPEHVAALERDLPDRLDALADALEDAPLTVTNARGDEVAQPLMVEARQQSIVLARLIAALRTLTRRAPLTVGLTYECEGRCPAPAEAAAYFLAAEALTNVVRYAGATRADIRVTFPGEHLAIEIADDGAGGADPANGSGLRGMADRLAALDGSLHVDSPPGGGTRVTGVIPCGS